MLDWRLSLRTRPMDSDENQAPQTAPRADKDRVVIFDTTLRDGEQCPGATMTFDEKLEVAELLDEMGVDIVEAGFPIASEGDFNSVQEISRRAKNSVICGLAGAIQGYRPVRGSHQAGQTRPHPYLQRNLAAASQISDGDGRERSTGARHRLRHARAELY